MTPDAVLARIDRLFADRGAREYLGEAVSQQEHALQSAAAAERDGATPELVAAALLHDVGHLLHPPGESADGDGRHEALGHRFLAGFFGPAVTEPVRLHVAAKRYLCAADPAYRAGLSAASERSLALQGGPMGTAEAAAFEREAFHEPAVRLRRWDDAAKVVGLPTPTLDHFRPCLRLAVAAANAAGERI